MRSSLHATPTRPDFLNSASPSIPGEREEGGESGRFSVILAEAYGMCFGVRDALGAVERLSEQEPVTVLGQLVHNEVVRGVLAAKGVRELSLDASRAPTDRLVVTAHGASRRDRSRWERRGYRVSDTTCPLVKRAHEALGLLVADGCHPVVIGKHGHVEVRGLIGDFPGAVVVESPSDLHAVPEHPRLGIIAQTTQPVARVRALVEAIRSMRPESEVVFRDTVCQPTKNRQAALENLCERADFVVVVGGSNSNNTGELVQSVRARGIRAERVGSHAELCPSWFRDAGVVGVTAGTSTLPGTVEQVVARLREIAGNANAGGGRCV